MEQIIYTSIAAANLDGADVFELVNRASARNRERGITGLLTYGQGRFYQAIEGEHEAISTLLLDLERDPRHHSIKIIKRRTIDVRQFPRWSMRRIHVKDIETARREFRSLVSKHDDAASILKGFDAFLEFTHRKAG